MRFLGGFLILLGMSIFCFHNELPNIVFFPANRIIAEISQAGGLFLLSSGLILWGNIREIRYLKHKRWKRLCRWFLIISMGLYCFGRPIPILQCEKIEDLQLIEGTGAVIYGIRGGKTEFYIQDQTPGNNNRLHRIHFCLLLNKIQEQQWINHSVKVWHSMNYAYQVAIDNEILCDIVLANQGIVWHNFFDVSLIYFFVLIILIFVYLNYTQ